MPGTLHCLVPKNDCCWFDEEIVKTPAREDSNPRLGVQFTPKLVPESQAHFNPLHYGNPGGFLVFSDCQGAFLKLEWAKYMITNVEPLSYLGSKSPKMSKKTAYFHS